MSCGLFMLTGRRARLFQWGSEVDTQLVVQVHSEKGHGLPDLDIGPPVVVSVSALASSPW